MRSAILEDLPKGASLQEYLDLTGRTLASLHPKMQRFIERTGEPLTAIPWSVVLIDHRPPTEAEIAVGLEIQRKMEAGELSIINSQDL